MLLKSAKLVILALLVLLFSQCGSDKKKLLCKKWKTIRFQNQKMDQEIAFMSHYIDTVGNEDKEIGKATDLDSLKMFLREDLKRMKEEQQMALENTIMEFQSNGVTYNRSIEGVDSAMYTLEEDRFIKIDEAKLKGMGETMTFEILKLTADTLQLQLVDYGDTSVATMIPAL